MIHRAPFFLPWLYPSLIWRGNRHNKSLYLTFDDGPIPEITEFVLETLNKFNVPGVFFMIGENIDRYPAIAGQVLKNNHQIGNHTYNHLNGWKTETEMYLANVNGCSQQVEKSLSRKTTLFRPPYGRITRAQLSRLRDFRIIMWDVLSGDFNPRLPPEKCLRETIRSARPGSIVVFHDSLKAEKNLRYMLPRFIDAMLNSGYIFRPLD